MGGIQAPRTWYDEAKFLPANWGGSQSPAAIVQGLRRKAAATRIEPGDRMAWLNLKLMATVSPVALAKANQYAA